MGFLRYNQLFSFLICFFNRSTVANHVLLETGLGQVQLKLGDLKSALTNFEKVLEVQPENCDTLKVSVRLFSDLGIW